ncbi:PREDICTED: uncharacterized protein LOC109230766 isoform X2 [Nicotiana attenuata]|uniref:Uncharacterized protein n=1 Tax=Nicotiana attenuata TaxID=49451 RepID=A0A1J6IEY2_NICAT|nr:PREDICTED: uncharacterized protein LOC109230766 isoform X2 [Nicotiana attenuata]OIS99071.1 hypothetical protein A4A49_20344 [Nicotiana attenuata]
MGILDELRAAAGKLLNRKVQQKSSNACALEGKYSAGITSAVSKIDGSVKYDGAQKTDDYVFYPDGREKIGRILSKLTKFAVVSAVDESLKTVAGGSKIIKEGLKDQSPSRPSTRAEKQDISVMMEEMQAKMEKFQDDMNNTKQQNEVSTKGITGLDSFEFSDEPIKCSTPSKSNRKKVFIRSRL